MNAVKPQGSFGEALVIKKIVAGRVAQHPAAEVEVEAEAEQGWCCKTKLSPC